MCWVVFGSVPPPRFDSSPETNQESPWIRSVTVVTVHCGELKTFPSLFLGISHACSRTNRRGMNTRKSKRTPALRCLPVFDLDAEYQRSWYTSFAKKIRTPHPHCNDESSKYQAGLAVVSPIRRVRPPCWRESRGTCSIESGGGGQLSGSFNDESTKYQGSLAVVSPIRRVKVQSTTRVSPSWGQLSGSF